MIMTADIRVTQWRTPEPTKDDATAQWHDCLWEVAAEQATLERMEKDGGNWQNAADKITDTDIVRHLDKICDDNGFRRLDGSGTGRNPDLIRDGEPIKVRIDPRDLTSTPDGLSSGQARTQYDRVTGGPVNVDLNVKRQLDRFLGNIPALAQLSDQTQAELISAYSRDVDLTKLTALVSTDAFRQCTPPQQQQLLVNYGKPGNEATTATIDQGVAANPKQDPDGVLRKVLETALSPPVADKAIPIGTRLDSEESFTTANGNVRLSMQKDGNLVVYVDDEAVWATDTTFWGLRFGPTGDHAVWQENGNLVLYASDGREAWSSGTAGNEGARLELGDDGRLTIYDKSDKKIWASGD